MGAQSHERPELANLFLECANVQEGQKILIIHEEAHYGFCDLETVRLANQFCQDKGCQTQVVEIPFRAENPVILAQTQEWMEEADVVVFFARLADQLRFQDFPESSKTVINYASKSSRLFSSFGLGSSKGLCAIAEKLDDLYSKALHVRVTCPRGTNFSGTGDPLVRIVGDVRVVRFPMVVHAPISTESYSGRVALPFLIGTSCNYYPNYHLKFDDTVFANFQGNRMLGFEGSEQDVKKAKDHLLYLANRFDVDPYRVFSWHSGIHPGNIAPVELADQPTLWCSGTFGNPRILHFHTCGNEPPGEISWNVIDPTVTVDGVTVCQNGEWFPHNIPGFLEVMDTYPTIRELFSHPDKRIGL